MECVWQTSQVNADFVNDRSMRFDQETIHCGDGAQPHRPE